MRVIMGMAAPMTCRRYKNHLALNYFYIHTTILPKPCTNQNPTVGFSARFFLKTSWRCKLLTIKALQSTYFQKSEKTQNKVFL